MKRMYCLRQIIISEKLFFMVVYWIYLYENMKKNAVYHTISSVTWCLWSDQNGAPYHGQWWGHDESKQEFIHSVILAIIGRKCSYLVLVVNSNKYIHNTQANTKHVVCMHGWKSFAFVYSSILSYYMYVRRNVNKQQIRKKCNN